MQSHRPPCIGTVTRPVPPGAGAAAAAAAADAAAGEPAAATAPAAASSARARWRRVTLLANARAHRPQQQRAGRELGRRHARRLHRPLPRDGGTEGDGPRRVLAQQAVLPRPLDVASLAGGEEAAERLGPQDQRASRLRCARAAASGTSRTRPARARRARRRARRPVRRTHPRARGEQRAGADERPHAGDDQHRRARRRRCTRARWPAGGRRFQNPDAADRALHLLGAHVAPRRGEVLVVAVEDDRVGAAEQAVQDRRVTGIGLGEARALGQHHVVAVALVIVSTSLAAWPENHALDGAVVDLLAQQHVALPRRDALRRHELGRRQLVHVRVSGTRTVAGRRAAGRGQRRWRRRRRRPPRRRRPRCGRAGGPQRRRRRRWRAPSGSISAASGDAVVLPALGERRLGHVGRRRRGRRSCRRR